MKWVSYTRSISSRIGEENPSNTIAEQNERIAQYLKKRGCSISEKYSDRKRTAEAAEGFDRLVQDGMARKFDAVVVDSIFRCGRTLPFAIEALSISMERPLIRFVRNLLPIARITLKKVH